MFPLIFSLFYFVCNECIIITFYECTYSSYINIYIERVVIVSSRFFHSWREKCMWSHPLSLLYVENYNLYQFVHNTIYCHKSKNTFSPHTYNIEPFNSSNWSPMIALQWDRTLYTPIVYFPLLPHLLTVNIPRMMYWRIFLGLDWRVNEPPF